MERSAIKTLFTPNYKTIKYPDVFKSVSNILIILPEDSKEIKSKIDSKPGFIEAPMTKKVSFLGDDDQMSGFDDLDVETIPITKKELNLFNKPKRGLIKLIRNKKFDFSADLNSKFNSIFAVIPLKSGIPLRMGFSQEKSLPYYNLKYILKESLTIKEKINFLFTLFL